MITIFRGKDIDMKLPKLIAADIDGTLVNDDGEMMELTRSALKILHKHGILLGIASGRAYDAVIKEKLKNWDFRPKRRTDF